MTLRHRLALALLAAVLAAAGGCEEKAASDEGTQATEGAIVLPSGREVSLIDVITDMPGPAGATARFRFLAPGLKQDDIMASADDMQALCDDFALARVAGMAPLPGQIVITLAAEAVPFGQAAPGVVQFFEAYRIEGDSCAWEQF